MNVHRPSAMTPLPPLLPPCPSAGSFNGGVVVRCCVTCAMGDCSPPRAVHRFFTRKKKTRFKQTGQRRRSSTRLFRRDSGHSSRETSGPCSRRYPRGRLRRSGPGGRRCGGRPPSSQTCTPRPAPSRASTTSEAPGKMLPRYSSDGGGINERWLTA